MSDLGEIFHVKKDGVQYDAHAYTTLDECPEPNLKLTYKGQQGYVKLEAKGEGDVPCYVKTKAGNTYQVKKEAIPTGSIWMGTGHTYTFTVPNLIKVIKVVANDNTNYVGVTPNSTHTLMFVRHGRSGRKLKCTEHSIWWASYNSTNATLYWSPEINKKTPAVTDY